MLRDLVVVLDSAAHSQNQFTLALDLARRDDAHVTALCAADALQGIPPGMLVGLYPEMPAFSDAVTEFRGLASKKSDEMEREFREQLRLNGLNGDWEVLTGLQSDSVVRRARSADLLVLQQRNPEETAVLRASTLIESALMSSGRPVLLVPYAGRFETVGRSVLIGWDGGREASRAVHDMLPLLAPYAKLTLLTVERPGPSWEGNNLPGTEIAAHLARHGLEVTASRTVRDAGVADADVLLNYASDIGADLLVVGAYGHSRGREFLLGGVTRDLLDHMTIPVLMAH